MPNEYLLKIAKGLSETKLDEADDYTAYFNNLQNESSGPLLDEQKDILKMLSGVCSFYFTPQEEYPYAPLAVLQGRRTMIPDDLSDGQLDILKELTNGILPPVLMARFCDVLWVRKKDYKAADKAIDTYLDCAERELNDHWFIAADYCRRAARIANQLGQKNPKRKVVFAKLMASFQIACTEAERLKKPHWALALAEMLMDECDEANIIELGKSCEDFADKLTGAWVLDEYYSLAARAFENAGQSIDRSRVYGKLGKCWEDDANRFKKPDGGDGMQISFRLNKAIEAYRNAGDKLKAEQLIKELKEANLLTIKQMKRFEIKLDVTKLLEEASGEMKDKFGMDAITSFASLVKLPAYKQMLDQVKERAQQFPLQHLMTGEILTSEGNISAVSKGGLSESNPDTLVGLAFQYDIHRKVSATVLESSRQIILKDDAQQWKKGIKELLRDHPLVPEDRTEIVFRSLVAGIEGDRIVFLHLIIPQLENSIREIAAKAGGKTTIMKQGVMREIDLNRLLTDDNAGKQEIVRVLGEDVVWDLRTLLVEQAGPNLRNRVSHGLATFAELNSPNAVYLLWLVLQILITHKSKK
jgi:hypothetical protein